MHPPLRTPSLSSGQTVHGLPDAPPARIADAGGTISQREGGESRGGPGAACDGATAESIGHVEVAVMSRAPRKPAEDVRVGDLILNCYAPRTWREVQAVGVDAEASEAMVSIFLDTASDRTWYYAGELVPCKPQSGDAA